MTDHAPHPTLPDQDFIAAGKGLAFLEQLRPVFAESRLLDVFDEEAAVALADYLTVYRQLEGKSLLKEGEKSDFAIMLLEGDVDVLKNDESGIPQLINTVVPGKVIGEMSLVDGEPRFATCVARTDVLVAVLTRVDLMAFIDRHPRLGSQLLMQLVALVSQRLRQTSKKLVALMARAPGTE